MSFRKLLPLGLALVAGLVTLAPPVATARPLDHAVTVLAWARVDGTMAMPDQTVRVTVINPKLVGPAAPVAAQVDYFLKIEGIDGEATIAPGEAHTFTIDPRIAGELVDPVSGARRVIVSLSVHARVPAGRSAPDPSITVELVNTRTGATEFFVPVPPFKPGVRVVAANVD